MSAARADPHRNFNFRVEIAGLVVGIFSEVTGLASESEVIAYRDGADATLRKLPGLPKYPPITLKRGLTADRSLWEWRKRISDGQPDRRNGHVILLDLDGKEVARWAFQNGWPSKWEGPTLDARTCDVAIETLEIVHEGLEWVT